MSLIINSFRFTYVPPLPSYDTGWRSSFSGPYAIVFSDNLAHVAAGPRFVVEAGSPPLATTIYAVDEDLIPGGGPDGDTGWLSVFGGTSVIDFTDNLTHVTAGPRLIKSVPTSLATTPYFVDVDYLPGGDVGDTSWRSVFGGNTAIDFTDNLAHVSTPPLFPGESVTPLADTAYPVTEDSLPGGGSDGDTGYLSTFGSTSAITFADNLTHKADSPLLVGSGVLPSLQTLTGDINVNGDFPATPADGVSYFVTASVTDPYHTNKSFVAGNLIYFVTTDNDWKLAWA